MGLASRAVRAAMLLAMIGGMLPGGVRLTARALRSPRTRGVRVTPRQFSAGRLAATKFGDVQLDDAVVEKIMSRKFAMKLALAHAAKAANKGEVPIGAVVLDDEGRVLSVGRNQVSQAGNGASLGISQ
uniref:CMP/dCMP-type deaminase domain-containing protein n=1 Tax=Phaeomonas parva TaxID=124430 RepID=A0A7S1XKG7_9STRA|mmetsp:Transcript_14913/g.44974  ORF Transcript_14913/g.44974 Transcript_14913/m.44974 type:complete len:128 (+) Transcript_14913:224-607(+)